MPKRIRRALPPLAIALTLALALATLVFRQSAPPTVESAFPAGEIVVGVDASYPPFALDDGESLRGLDIDLAAAIGRELGLGVRFVNIGFYALHDALISGHVDLLISALRIDPARMEDLRYTQPYFDAGYLLVSPPEATILSPDALDKAKIAYEYASAADGKIRAWEAAGIRLSRLPYETPAYALDALRLGIAEAALVDATTFRLYQRSHADWSAIHQHVTHEFYAIALRIDRVAAWKLVDGALDALKANGELARIIDAWL